MPRSQNRASVPVDGSSFSKDANNDANRMPRYRRRICISVPRGAAVLTGLGAGEQHVRLRIDQDALITAAVGADPHDFMSTACQILEDSFGNADLRLHGATALGWQTCRGCGADVFNPRRFPGLLDIHAEVNEVAQHLHLALRLHVAAHDAEHEPRLTGFGYQRRDNSVERPFVRLEAV